MNEEEKKDVSDVIVVVQSYGLASQPIHAAL